MSSLRERALGLLARREHSRRELQQKLKSADNSEQIQQLLHDLAEENLQSDARFAESFIGSRLRAGFGPLKIEYELVQRGINKELIYEFMPQDDDFWRESLQTLWDKKYHAILPRDEKSFARQSRFLVQRGFPPSMVTKFLSSMKKRNA